MSVKNTDYADQLKQKIEELKLKGYSSKIAYQLALREVKKVIKEDKKIKK
jgi:hypothetical protein